MNFYRGFRDYVLYCLKYIYGTEEYYFRYSYYIATTFICAEISKS